MKTLKVLIIFFLLLLYVLAIKAQSPSLIIDNFAPYVEKVEINSGADLVYEAEWKWGNPNPNELGYHSTCFNKAADGNNDVIITIYMSENMSDVTVAIDDIPSADDIRVARDGSDKQWKATVNRSAIEDLFNEECLTQHRITINGHDISGNAIQGFGKLDIKRVVGDIKVRTTATQFTPGGTFVEDTKHVLKIGNSIGGSYKSSMACLITEFSANKTTLIDDEKVVFTDKSTGPITDWHWVIEKGGIKEFEFHGEGPHTREFNDAGVYDVSLTISDEINELTEKKESYIAVTHSPTYDVDLDFIYDPVTNKLTGISSGDVISWEWNFGMSNPIHLSGQVVTYPTFIPVYSITLTATFLPEHSTKSITHKIYRCGF